MADRGPAFMELPFQVTCALWAFTYNEGIGLSLLSQSVV